VADARSFLTPEGRDIHRKPRKSAQNKGPLTRDRNAQRVGRVWSITDFEPSGRAEGPASGPQRSAKDHWPAFIDNEIPRGMGLITWITRRTWLTATGRKQVRTRNQWQGVPSASVG